MLCPTRGDFLIGLAQEALFVTRRRKLEKEIAVIKSALKLAIDDKPTTRRARQLKTRLDKLKDQDLTETNGGALSRGTQVVQTVYQALFQIDPEWKSKRSGR